MKLDDSITQTQWGASGREHASLPGVRRRNSQCRRRCLVNPCRVLCYDSCSIGCVFFFLREYDTEEVSLFRCHAYATCCTLHRSFYCCTRKTVSSFPTSHSLSSFLFRFSLPSSFFSFSPSRTIVVIISITRE